MHAGARARGDDRRRPVPRVQTRCHMPIMSDDLVAYAACLEPPTIVYYDLEARSASFTAPQQ